MDSGNKPSGLSVPSALKGDAFGQAPLSDAEIAQYAQWIGRTEESTEEISAAPLAGWFATLDCGAAALLHQELPALAQWLYFLPRAPQSLLGDDGHPERGGFLPPIRLARRMWAGGRLDWVSPLRVGDTATRISRVAEVKHKRGRTGELVFVVVEHEIRCDRRLVLTEYHDIVYRSGATAAVAPPASSAEPHKPDWTERIEPTEALLFRYSALTFNAHRIHYDRRYAMEVEHYPGLVVHGPLIATLLLQAAARYLGHSKFTHFDFQARRPLFDTTPFDVSGRLLEGGASIELWASDLAGTTAMSAHAEVSP